jgi:hypothetical protein
MVTHIWASPAGRVFAVGTAAGGASTGFVILTDDRGDTWSVASDDLPFVPDVLGGTRDVTYVAGVRLPTNLGKDLRTPSFFGVSRRGRPFGVQPGPRVHGGFDGLAVDSERAYFTSSNETFAIRHTGGSWARGSGKPESQRAAPLAPDLQRSADVALARERARM